MNFLRPLAYPLMALALVGWMASLIVNVTSLFGVRFPFFPNDELLFTGVFVVIAPAILIAQRRTKDLPREEASKAVYRGCPRWMDYALRGFGTYALANFFILFLSGFIPAVAQFYRRSGLDNEFGKTRLESSYSTLFYFAAFAILFSWVKEGDSDSVRRCPHGHPVSPSATHCKTCSAEIVPRRR